MGAKTGNTSSRNIKALIGKKLGYFSNIISYFWYMKKVVRFFTSWVNGLIKDCERYIKFRSTKSVSWDFEFFPPEKKNDGNASRGVK